MVYGVREESEALFLDELLARQKDIEGFNLVLLESNKGEFVRVDIMKTKVDGGLGDYNYFLCGPKPMVDGVRKDLAREGVPKGQLHWEAFEFR